ncbi:rhodanese-like domain-containing protein [Paenibacillus sp. J5C_2022]|uniref:rhodanese-like domain-containing protein n=1 Tax=Paenibacillus sp. J5C2022 TaxID=2977129 RepID=UPI0021CE8930|nr:rhodanese-like domain-containing protein [Paenibacillus sp. J5C2022]MCU6713221.1 rhodanese-like domain-containing protein [Paenibacillus sp. J5C2022]
MAGKYAKEATPKQVQDRLDQGEQLYMLDVREEEEWHGGHIAGANHIPLGQLGQRMTELNADRELIVICRSGNRSGLACELLEANGFNVVNMAGGMLEWAGPVTYGQ